MRRHRFLAPLACLFAMLGFGPPAGAAEPIDVIAMFNLTGPNAVLDLPSLNGAKLAVDQLNESGGVLGRTINLIPVDTMSDLASVAGKAAAALEAAPDAVAGIGYSYSEEALAAGRVFQAAGLPFISPGATAPDLPKEVGDTMFLAAYGDNAQAEAMAAFAHDQLKVRHVALWVDESRLYTRTVGVFFKKFFEQRGGTVSQRRYAGKQTDFSDLIARLKTANPPIEALYAATVPATAVPLIKQVRAAGIGIPLLSGDGWDDAEIVEASKAEGITGIYFTTHHFLGVDTKAMRDFVSAYKAAHGEAPPNAFAPLGFDSVNLLAHAIRSAGSADPRAVRAALAATRDFQGTVGPIRYAPGKRVPQKPVAVIAVDRGRETPAWLFKP